MRTKDRTLQGSEGFTLIEIMVVIAIIAALIGAGSLMINIGIKKKAVMQTQSRLSAIGAALEQLRSNDQLGRYPPTQIGKLVFQGFDGKKFGGQPNEDNVGIETVYVVFRLPLIAVMPQGVDDAIANTDDDKCSNPVGKLQKPDLFEYVDSWDNPLVYISASDYKDTAKVEQYVLGDGQHTKVKAVAKKNATTGEYLRPDSFQLYSMGPDGVPDTDDDLVYGL